MMDFRPLHNPQDDSIVLVIICANIPSTEGGLPVLVTYGRFSNQLRNIGLGHLQVSTIQTDKFQKLNRRLQSAFSVLSFSQFNSDGGNAGKCGKCR